MDLQVDLEQKIQRAWAIRKAIEGLDERIARLESAARQGHLEKNTVGYLTLLNRLYRDKDCLYMEEAQIDEAINLVKDPLKREILRARFVCKKSRKETAERFYYSENRITQLTKEAMNEIKEHFIVRNCS